MPLQETPGGDQFFVRRCAVDRITVVDRELMASFILTPDRVVESWPAASAATLAPSHAELLLDLRPEVILLGTGSRQVFPPASFRAAILSRGVGVEPMDNAAAARTFNLLAAEGRRVIAAFILPG
jgi:uncharacterized protein